MRTTTTNRLAGLGLVVALLALVPTTVRHAIAQDPPAEATPPGAERTLHLIERLVTVEVLDLGVEGDSIGDLLAFHNPIYDDTNSRELGVGQGSCVRTVAGSAWECMWTAILPEGQVTTAGPFYDAADSVVAVTGGTGAYAGATGQMRLRARNAEGTEFDFIYELR